MMKNMQLLSVLFMFILLGIAKAQDIDICPDPESIFPCVCESREERPSMECMNITSEEELESIFSVYFPEPNMEMLTIESGELTEISKNVFGNCSFEIINIDTEYITSISDSALENSITSLILLAISNCPITSRSFPFSKLDKFTNLTQIRLSNNHITKFPDIVSNSLRRLFILDNELLTVIPDGSLYFIPYINTLDLEGCGIERIEEGALEGAKQLSMLSLRDNKLAILPTAFFVSTTLIDLDLYKNEISYIPSGYFDGLPALESLDLGYNMIQRLEVTTFGENSSLRSLNLIHNDIALIEPDTFNSTPALLLIDLGFNNITTLQTGTFNGLTQTAVYLDYNNLVGIEANSFGEIADSFINLQWNEIEDLYEYWLRPLLDYENDVYLYGNTRLGCGCEIAWLFDDPDYQNHVFVECENGTFFSELNPDYYQENCPNF